MTVMQNYAELLFTDAVKAYQEQAGMRETYERIYSNRHRGPLDEDTIAFLSGSTSCPTAGASALSRTRPARGSRGGRVPFLL